MSKILSLLLVWILVMFFFRCSTKISQTPEKGIELNYEPGPPTIIYQTTKDYNNKVALIMNDAKTEIIYYPDPKDVYYAGKLAFPTRLENGFLLDNQGINKNVVFTKYTLEEYAALEYPPSLTELMNNIVDKEPLISMCNCGNRTQFINMEHKLNEVVKQDLKSCKKIK